MRTFSRIAESDIKVFKRKKSFVVYITEDYLELFLRYYGSSNHVSVPEKIPALFQERDTGFESKLGENIKNP